MQVKQTNNENEMGGIMKWGPRPKPKDQKEINFNHIWVGPINYKHVDPSS